MVPQNLGDLVAVAAGRYHNLSLRADGTVVAWGSNRDEFGKTANQSVVPTGLSDVVAIAAGGYHSLALKADGTVVTWGNKLDEFGGVPVLDAPAGLDHVVAITAGRYHSVALRTNGEIVAWGGGVYGQLEVPANLAGIVAISAGSYHTLALQADGKVIAWGNNGEGQTAVPADLDHVKAIAAGGFHSMALLEDGTVRVWGNNEQGQSTPPAGLADVAAIGAGARSSLAIRNDEAFVGWGDDRKQQLDLGVYRRGVFALFGGETHTVGLFEGPRLLSPLTEQLVAEGSTVRLSVQATGRQPLSYEWRRNGLLIEGENGSVLSLVSVKPAQTGIYKVTITDAFGASLENAAYVIVNHPPPAGEPESRSDLFEYPANIELLNSSGVAVGFSSSKLFSGGDGTDPGENLLFNGGNGPEFVHFIEWRTKSSVMLSKVVLHAANGAQSPASANEFRTFVLKAKQNPEDEWRLVASTGLPNPFRSSATNHYTVLDAEIEPVEAQFYRAEFTQRDATPPRVIELDGFGVGIFENPLDLSIPQGLKAEFSARAVGEGLHYQWYHGETPIEGATSAVYTIPAVSMDDQGGYKAVVTSGSLMKISTTATLQVLPPVHLETPIRPTKTGRGVAWGLNDSGQADVPPEVGELVAVAAGVKHSLGLKPDGTVVAWGANTDQAGNPVYQAAVPDKLGDVVAIAAGGYHSLALKADGTVVAWGNNRNEVHEVSGQSTVPAGLGNVVAIAAGKFHSLALRSSGDVVVWGSDYFGQLRTPSRFQGIISIAAGGYHSLAVNGEGSVFAWGTSTSGVTNVPPRLPQAVAVAAGEAHSLVVLRSGEVVGWGENGQLQRTPPPGLTNVIAVVSGAYHNFSIKQDGGIASWGSNGNGQRATPYHIRNFFAPAAGYAHTVALSQGPALVRPLGDVALLEGRAGGFFADTISPRPLSFQWFHDGNGIDGENSPSLFFSPAKTEDTGRYSVVISDDSGFRITNSASLAVPIRGQPESSADVFELAGNSEILASSLLPPGSEPLRLFSANPGGSELVFADGRAFGFAHFLEWRTKSLVLLNKIALHAANDGAAANFGREFRTFTLKAKKNATDEWVVVASANTPKPYTSSQINDFTVFIGTFDTISAQYFRAEFTQDGPTPPTGRRLGPRLLELDGFGLAIARHPLDSLVPEGSQARFSVTASGENLAYQWYRSDGLIDGATNRTLILTNVALPDVGIYKVTVTSGELSLTSSNAMLSILPRVVLKMPSRPTREGRALAWGLNNSGQGEAPVDIGPLVAISAGWSHNLGLRADGTVVAWGANTNESGVFVGQSVVPDGLERVVAIAAGGYHNLALREDGTVVAWGANTDETRGYVNQSEVPHGLNQVVAVAAGLYHSAALRLNGEVVLWGSNSRNQLKAPAGLSEVIAISAGGMHTMVLKNDRSVLDWGGITNSASIFTNLINIKAIAAGGVHGLALDEAGNLSQWGLPYWASPPVGLSNVVRIAAGGGYSLVANLAGGVTAWGQGVSNVLAVPKNLRGVFEIAGGGRHALALSDAAAITKPLTNMIVERGATVILDLGVSALSSASVRWYKNGGPIPGADSTRLKLSSIRPEDAGDYKVVVSDASGEFVESSATIIVNYAPLAGEPESITDLFEYPANVQILGSSAVVAGADVSRLFSPPRAGELRDGLVFASASIGFTHFAEWKTKSPVLLEKIVLHASNVTNSAVSEEFGSFRLLARLNLNDAWTAVSYAGMPKPYNSFAGNFFTVVNETFAPVHAQFFRAEFIQRDDPRNGGAGPRVLELDGFGSIPVQLSPESSSFDGKQFAMKLTGRVGGTYRIEFSEDLKSWSELTTLLNNGDGQIVDSELEGSKARFYRAVPLD